MGANLAVDGKVLGDCLQCPFHGWRFRGTDGKCTYIPYADSIPVLAKVKTWPVVELNGFIFLWYHAEGLVPHWHVHEFEEISRGDWKCHGRSEHLTYAHIEDVSQNAADMQHMYTVHGTTERDNGHRIGTRWDIAKHEWTCAWEAQPPPNGHIAFFSLLSYTQLFGKRMPFLDFAVKLKQIGPGIWFEIFETKLGKGVVIGTITPSGPSAVKIVFKFYGDSSMPAFVVKLMVIVFAWQLERDVLVWNNKRYAPRPVFVKSKEDTLLAQHRRWFQQFYSENSPRLKFQKDSMDW